MCLSVCLSASPNPPCLYLCVYVCVCACCVACAVFCVMRVRAYVYACMCVWSCAYLLCVRLSAPPILFPYLPTPAYAYVPTRRRLVSQYSNPKPTNKFTGALPRAWCHNSPIHPKPSGDPDKNFCYLGKSSFGDPSTTLCIPWQCGSTKAVCSDEYNGISRHCTGAHAAQERTHKHTHTHAQQKTRHAPRNTHTYTHRERDRFWVMKD